MSRRDDLRRLLDAYSPSPAEEVHLERMLVLLAEPGDVFSRDHFVPGHFTASAFVLSPDRTAMALVHHERLGRWLQPGGHIEPDDASVPAAAQRELAEELGMVHTASDPHGSAFDLDIHEIPAHGAEPSHRHYDVRFLFVAHDERIIAGEGAAEARWLRLDRVPDIVEDASVLRAAAKLRAGYLR